MDSDAVSNEAGGFIFYSKTIDKRLDGTKRDKETCRQGTKAQRNDKSKRSKNIDRPPTPEAVKNTPHIFSLT